MKQKKFKKIVERIDEFMNMLFDTFCKVFGVIGFMLALLIIPLILEEETPKIIYYLTKGFGFSLGFLFLLVLLIFVLKGVAKNKNNFD